jgi:peptide deformylase
MSRKIDNQNLDASEIKDLTKQVERDMLLQIAETMSNYIQLVQCYSVNAKQLGIPADAFMINSGLFCFKPKIILYGSDRVKMLEYSSISKESIEIYRPGSVVAGYVNYHGDRVVRDLYGVEARYFQHEIDNLSGNDWKNRATQAARIKATKVVLH